MTRKCVVCLNVKSVSILLFLLFFFPVVTVWPAKNVPWRSLNVPSVQFPSLRSRTSRFLNDADDREDCRDARVNVGGNVHRL